MQTGSLPNNMTRENESGEPRHQKSESRPDIAPTLATYIHHSQSQGYGSSGKSFSFVSFQNAWSCCRRKNLCDVGWFVIARQKSEASFAASLPTLFSES